MLQVMWCCLIQGLTQTDAVAGVNFSLQRAQAEQQNRRCETTDLRTKQLGPASRGVDH
jgi:hypothetical protein